MKVMKFDTSCVYFLMPILVTSRGGKGPARGTVYANKDREAEANIS
jgi:hypothetical protein